jgi:hypothetical protein
VILDGLEYPPVVGAQRIHCDAEPSPPSDAYGPVVYYIWVKGHKPAQRTSTAKGKKA